MFMSGALGGDATTGCVDKAIDKREKVSFFIFLMSFGKVKGAYSS
jgi:hypothetical protein